MRARISDFTESRRGQRFLRGLRVVLTLGIVAFLLYQLSRIGWEELWRSLPTTPWFYIVWLATYAALPISEVFIYRRVWGGNRLGLLFASLRKRALNADVLGYSGEVYLYVWARDRVRESRKRILHTIKDVTITSSLVSIGSAALLLAILLGTGQVRLDQWFENTNLWYVAGGAAILLLVTVLLVQFRSVVFSLPARTLGWISAIHTGRYMISFALYVVLWWTVIPEASFQAWALLLTVLVLIERIPFLPSTDLLFVGIGIELYAAMGVPQAALAGMLLVQGVLYKICNASFFIGTTLWEKHVLDLVRSDEDLHRSTIPSDGDAPRETRNVPQNVR